MRIAQAAALSVISGWFCFVPAAAPAQGLGSLVVTITSPQSGSTVSGSISVSASVTVLGSLTVAGVQFKLDGVNLGAEDTSVPYAVSWDTTTTGNGSHILTAVARDQLGAQWTSDPVTVTVSNHLTVAITSPLPGSTVAGTITIEATASGDLGVLGVEFQIDGGAGVEDTTAPYAVSWDTTAFSNGSHTLTAIARDAAGNRATSASVPVTVSNTTIPPECATPLNPFPGSTLFNNTVRAQMWITDNTWWGVFSDASTGIYFYRLEGSTFIKGGLIDPSFAAGRPDTVWNGSELFILVQQSGSLAKLYKYSYSTFTRSFTLIGGFPIDLPLAGLATTVALDQDSTGKLWATYPSGGSAYVIWSTSADHLTWNTTGFVLASDLSTVTPEASTITHFGGDKIGVVWGNQALNEYDFRFHRDADPEAVWSPKEIVDCCAGRVADNHVSLRAAPDGRLFLVAKDSIDTGNLHLFVRGVNGPWGQKTSVDSDPLAQPTRPTLALHVETDHAYVIYRNSTDGQTYVTRSSMSSPGFGLRCVFLTHGTNVTSTKQNVNTSTGLVAADSDAGQIFPARIDLASAAGSVTFAAESKKTSAPAATVTALDPEDHHTRSLAQAGSMVAATTAGTALLDGTPVAGFGLIWPGRLSTSAAPADTSQWWWVRAQGVNTIVNLDAVMHDFTQYAFEGFLWMPLGERKTPSREEVKRFLRFIQLCDHQPAHISGGTQEGRATLVALLRYAIDGWSIEDALAEGQRLNAGGALSTERVTWLLGWAATHSPGSDRLNSCSPR
jgi:hypothetical protein